MKNRELRKDFDLVQTEIITPEVGAEKLGVTVDELKSDMKAAGFHTPA